MENKIWLASYPRSGNTRFKDFSSEPEPAVEALAAFLGLRPLRSFAKSFKDLKSVDPKFFRAGDNSANISKLAGADLELFKSHHGALMSELGYWSSLPAGLRSRKNFSTSLTIHIVL